MKIFRHPDDCPFKAVADFDLLAEGLCRRSQTKGLDHTLVDNIGAVPVTRFFFIKGTSGQEFDFIMAEEVKIHEPVIHRLSGFLFAADKYGGPSSRSPPGNMRGNRGIFNLGVFQKFCFEGFIIHVLQILTLDRQDKLLVFRKSQRCIFHEMYLLKNDQSPDQ